MLEETLITIDRLNGVYKRYNDPTGIVALTDTNQLARVSEKVIMIFVEEGMTYEESYSTLNFIYEVLRYKSQKVNL